LSDSFCSLHSIVLALHLSIYSLLLCVILSCGLSELRASVTDRKTSTFKDPKLLSVPWSKETIYFGWTHIFSASSSSSSQIRISRILAFVLYPILFFLCL